MATATKALITAEEFERMTFDQRAELVRGEIIEMTNPGPAHGVVCANIVQRLFSWSPQGSKGLVILNDARLQTSHSPDSVRGADIVFLANERVPEGGITDQSLKVPPDLAVEVFSPSDRWRAVHDKVNDYLSMGIREVWVVHLRRRHVHIFRPDDEPAILSADAELTTDVLPGFCCTVGDFFSGL